MIELSKVLINNQISKVPFNNLRIEKLVIPETGLVVVKGEHKQGKTTLINFLSGKLSNYKGEIFLGKYILKGHSQNKMLRKTSVILGGVSQVKTNLTVFDNIVSTITKINKIILQDIDALVKLLEIPSLTLIVGNNKLLIFKTLLLRSLIENPNLLLIDNIQDYIDESTFYESINLIKKISQKIAVLITTTFTNSFDITADVIGSIKDNSLIIVKNNKNYENHFELKSINRENTNTLCSLARHSLKLSSKLNILLLLTTILLSIVLGLSISNTTSFKGYLKDNINYSKEFVITNAQYFSTPEKNNLLTISPDPRKSENLLKYTYKKNEINITPPLFTYIGNHTSVLNTKYGRKPKESPTSKNIELLITTSYAKKLLKTLPGIYKINDLINKEFFTNLGIKYQIVGIVDGLYDVAYINENYIANAFLKNGFDFLPNTNKVNLNEFHLNLSQDLINYLNIIIYAYPHKLNETDKIKLKECLIENNYVDLNKIDVVIDKVLEGENKVEFSLSYLVMYLARANMHFTETDSIVVTKIAIEQATNKCFIDIPNLNISNYNSNTMLDTSFVIISVLLFVAYIIINCFAVIHQYNNNKFLVKEISNSESQHHLFNKSLFLSSFIKTLCFFLPGFLISSFTYFITTGLINAYSISILFLVLFVGITVFLITSILINSAFLLLKKSF